MGKLKSTVKTHTDYGPSTGFKRSFGYVFSDDVEDWQYSDNQLGRERRRKAKREQEQQRGARA